MSFSRLTSSSLRPLMMQSTRSVFTASSIRAAPLASFTTSSFRPSTFSSPLLRSSPLLSSSSALIPFSASSSSRRSFSSSTPANKATEAATDFVSRLQTASTEQLYHYSSQFLAVSTPIALILSPTILNVPVDFGLGVIIPYHTYVGMKGVLEDYIPRPQQPLAKTALVVIMVLTTIGLLKINLCGAGITESFKSLWREPKVEDKKVVVLKKVP